MAKPRDTYKYQFKVGNKIVHGGITTDLGRREAEHQPSKGGTTRYVVVRESPSGSFTKVVSRDMHERGLRAASKVLSKDRIKARE